MLILSKNVLVKIFIKFIIISIILIFFYIYKNIDFVFYYFLRSNVLLDKAILTFLKYGIRYNFNIIKRYNFYFNINYIYDIFHNDNNKIIIIMPAVFFPPSIKYINSNSN